MPPFSCNRSSPAGTFRPEILDLHFQRRADAREGIGEGGDQRPIAQIPHRVRRDRVEQFAPLLAVEHRRLAGFYDVLRTAHGRGRVCRHNLAGDEPIEQHPHGGELLLHARRGMGLLERLDISGDIERPDRRQRQPAILAPGEELVAGPRVSSARVRIADIGGEEFDIAPGGRLAGVGDQRRHKMGVDRGRELAGLEDRGKMMVGGCHDPFPSPNLTHDKGRYHA